MHASLGSVLCVQMLSGPLECSLSGVKCAQSYRAPPHVTIWLVLPNMDKHLYIKLKAAECNVIFNV